jgi:hypothetical protein
LYSRQMKDDTSFCTNGKDLEKLNVLVLSGVQKVQTRALLKLGFSRCCRFMQILRRVPVVTYHFVQ